MGSAQSNNTAPPCFGLFCPPISKKKSDLMGSPMPATPLDRLRQRKTAMVAANEHPTFLSNYSGLEKDTSDEWNDVLPVNGFQQAEVHDGKVRLFITMN